MKSNGSMNRVFRVVWNAAKSVWQAVSEVASGHGKGNSGKAARQARRGWNWASLTAGTLIVLALPAQAAPAADALPTGGVVTAGGATISTSGARMDINQTTQKAAIDWQSFNIGSAAHVHFEQPAGGIALNRILGNDASAIYGKLTATGQVFLTNPNGVLFAPGAQVNVGGLVASTLNISNTDFMAGNYRFSGSSNSSIINQANITAANGGAIALIAAKIVNEGTLTAQQGNVLMAAGSNVTLDLGGPVRIQVNEGTLNALIESGGAIKADGGTVLLTARAAGDLAASVINHTGVIEAQTLSTGQQGKITLLGEGELITVSGKLDASAPNGGTGGRIVATGTRVLIDDGAHLTASGQNGGGEVLVGGSWQNSDTSVYQATATVVRAGATLEANATDNGDGGTVVAWSDITNPDSVTRAYGTFEAKGGASGGDGGRIETSGNFLDTVGAKVRTVAAMGQTGLWLLDPTNIYISTANNNYSGGGWSGGTFSGGSGDATLNAAGLVSDLGGTNIKLTATTTIFLQTNLSWSSSNSLELRAYNIDLGANSIEANGNGNLVLNYSADGSNGYLSGSGAINLGSGQLRIRANESLGSGTGGGTLSGNITAGSMQIESVRGLNFTGSTYNVGGTVNFSTVSGRSSPIINIGSSGFSSTRFNGSGEVRLTNSVTLGGVNTAIHPS